MLQVVHIAFPDTAAASICTVLALSDP